METLSIKDFSLKATLESGQIFRYHHDNNNGSNSNDNFYYVVAGDSIIKIRQLSSRIEYGCSSNSFNVKKFLGLSQSRSYSEILSSISRDEKITAAINKHYGLRILEQEPWECTASFICTAFSNIPRIKQCLEKVAATFGSSIEFDGFATFSFPQPQQINDFSKLSKCGLGYRAKYLFETAKIFAKDRDSYSPQQLRKLGYEEAKEKIMELPGVGSKVADCILLFSYGFFESFPVDVWIYRAMSNMYGREIHKFFAARETKITKITERKVAEFARRYFGKYAGYAQQFLYHFARAGRTRAGQAPRR